MLKIIQVKQIKIQLIQKTIPLQMQAFLKVHHLFSVLSWQFQNSKKKVIFYVAASAQNTLIIICVSRNKRYLENSNKLISQRQDVNQLKSDTGKKSLATAFQ